MMSSQIKLEFGRRFREARDAKKLSRAALGLRLGISPKTIQSWEMGRTFIEDLSLIPAIQAELDISVSDLIAESTTATGLNRVAEQPAAYGSRGARSQEMAKAGPVTPRLTIQVLAPEKAVDEKLLTAETVAVPVLRPTSSTKNVSQLTVGDIASYALIPTEWVPRGGVLVAFRMSDSSMAPMIPLGAVVIVDRRAVETEKVGNKVVAMFLQSKGLRIRRFVRDPLSGVMMGLPVIEGRRGKCSFRPDLGDQIIGRIVGILAQPE